MDKATILAAIDEAKEQQGKNFKQLKAKGDQIGENLKAIKEKTNKITLLKAEIINLERGKDALKEDLTSLKIREANILGTKSAFETMLKSVS